MKTDDLETSISDFLALGKQLLTSSTLTGDHVLRELLDWYKKNRVLGASVDENADMVLLQWGAEEPRNLTEPVDLRTTEPVDFHTVDEETLFSPGLKYQYLDFTRQVFANNEEKSLDFDDVALQMSITLYFQPATGREPNSNLWIQIPTKIEQADAKFRETPFVAMLLNRPAWRATCKVENCG